MSILIKGMEMPSKGQGRMFLYDDNTAIWLNLDTGERVAYEVIPVPTPHGRLIDADALLTDANKLRYGEGWLITTENIEHTPTIIEAEENEND